MDIKRPFMIFLSFFLITSLIGCEKTTNEFYTTLVGENNTYCFRGLTKQMSWEDVVAKENIDTTKVKPSLFKDYEYQEPIYFEELGTSFLRGYAFTVDNKLSEAEYVYYSNNKEELDGLMIKIGNIMEKTAKKLKIKPDVGSIEEIKSPLMYYSSDSEKVTKWEHKAQDGSMLIIWAVPKMVRIIVRYSSL